MIAGGCQILVFCRSCLSFLALFCRNKLNGCPQCAQTDGKTVKTVMASRRSLFPSISAATTPRRLVSLQTIAYIQALWIHSLSYRMPSKPLAAQASVFNCKLTSATGWCRVDSRDGTRLNRRRILQRFFQNAGLLLWRHRALGGCIWASFWSARRRRVSKGDEFNKAAPAPPAPAAPVPAAGENGARPANEPPTPPAAEGAEAGASDQREQHALHCDFYARPKAEMKNKASMSLSCAAVCA